MILQVTPNRVLSELQIIGTHGNYFSAYGSGDEGVGGAGAPVQYSLCESAAFASQSAVAPMERAVLKV